MERFAQPVEQKPGIWNKTRAKVAGILLAAMALGGGIAAMGSVEASGGNQTPAAELPGHPCNTLIPTTTVCQNGTTPPKSTPSTETTLPPTTETTPSTVPPTAPPTTGEGGPTPTPARPPETTATTMDLAPSH